MIEFHGLDDFRAELKAAGWMVGQNNMAAGYNGCNWYAWRRDRIDAPDCQCNDRPPSLMVWPHVFSQEFRSRYKNMPTATGSVELELSGQRDGNWLKFGAYSIKPEEFFSVLPLASRQLVAAWRAAAEVV